MIPEVHRFDRPVLLWRLPAGSRAVSTAVVGGGIGPCEWIINVEVHDDYHRDPIEHLSELITELRLSGRGAGMLTAAAIQRYVRTSDEGVDCTATVGLSHPRFAAAPTENVLPVGTINTFCWVPVSLEDAALVNLVVTATEAKTQALVELGVAGTGTPSDAVVIACPDGPGEQFGGPRSRWGARLARAVHAATVQGARGWVELSSARGGGDPSGR
ncbi:adenosylcobinamide amidohydrolase [Lentzea guizhouensis]|uniref:adenosylcobinamide amidohydrolase n=1 Tax=Lentzea guizhouensis TaxID=1586287 RepID=UPI00214FA6CB|nr:adenosylcobinamide amidohydrolase [Lentzea guizhouensis]